MYPGGISGGGNDEVLGAFSRGSPGGIIEGGNDDVLGAFSRGSHDSFQVTVIGPDAGTICKS